MKLCTVPVRNNARLAGFVLALSAVAIFSALHGSYIKQPQNIIQNLPGDSVIQPPLKTASADGNYSDFKKQWQARHTKETLDSIKR